MTPVRFHSSLYFSRHFFIPSATGRGPPSVCPSLNAYLHQTVFPAIHPSTEYREGFSAPVQRLFFRCFLHLSTCLLSACTAACLSACSPTYLIVSHWSTVSFSVRPSIYPSEVSVKIFPPAHQPVDQSFVCSDRLPRTVFPTLPPV